MADNQMIENQNVCASQSLNSDVAATAESLKISESSFACKAVQSLEPSVGTQSKEAAEILYLLWSQ
jgi:hypothetical protein